MVNRSKQYKSEYMFVERDRVDADAVGRITGQVFWFLPATQELQAESKRFWSAINYASPAGLCQVAPTGYSQRVSVTLWSGIFVHPHRRPSRCIQPLQLRDYNTILL